METSINTEEYQSAVLACTAEILCGVDPEDTLTNPMGPCGKLAGNVDLDALADCIQWALDARRLTRTHVMRDRLLLC